MNWQQQASQFVLEGDAERLARHVTSPSAHAPDSVLVSGYSGLVSFLRGDLARSLQIWEQAIALGSTASEQQQRREMLFEQMSAQARQLTEEKPELALALYRQLGELIRDRAANVLAVVLLEADLGEFDPDAYPPTRMTELLTAVAPGSLDPELAGRAIAVLLQRGQPPFEALLEAAVPHLGSRRAELWPAVELAASDCLYVQADDTRALALARCGPQLEPDRREAYSFLCEVCTLQGRFSEAIAAAEQELERSQTSAEKLTSNTYILRALLRSGSWLDVQPIVDRQRQWLDALVRENPTDLSPRTGDRLVIVPHLLAYIDDDPRELRWWHERLGDLFCQHLPPLSLPPLPPARPLSKASPLRLGYIGSTFRHHSVGWLCRWLLQYRDREQFHVTLYLIYQQVDKLTERICQQSDRVRRLPNNPYEAAHQIRRDGIEILVDLDSVTFTTTYRALAYKPAPVQVTWLGWDASGLPTIDYFLADRHVLPGNAQDYYRETLWRLPGSYIAVDGFEIGVPQRRREDFDLPPDAIVYFSAQNGSKRHPNTIRSQLQILKAVPESYLAVKGVSDEAVVRDLFGRLAEEIGVSPQRLRFLPVDIDEMRHRAHLALADIVLDTYPYNGATTTLEALWVGLPLVTRAGDQFVARNSYAFLTQLGIREGIARNESDYIDWGVKFGTDPDLRWRVACRLRESRQRSPLWNARQFAREMEAAYRQMWSDYVDRQRGEQ